MSAKRTGDSSAPVVERVPTADGLTLAVDLYRCDAPRAVVLLLHGGGQSRHAWDVTAQRLHQRGYTVAAYDTRDTGTATGTPTDATTGTGLDPTYWPCAHTPIPAALSPRSAPLWAA